MVKKRGLGRGLDALLGIESGGRDIDESPSSRLQDLSIELIETGRYQPRRQMSDEKLRDLASSIRSRGVVQPIVVRPLNQDRFELVAGERRWRAAKMAGLSSIPALVKPVSNEEAMSIALIENIQREQLNAMEEAQALDRLVREFNMTHQQVADAIGRSRAGVSNMMRLLDLSPDVRDIVESGRLDMGHGRALLSLPQDLQLYAANKILGDGLSVRQTENLVKKLTADGEEQTVKKKLRADPDVTNLELTLTERIGCKTRIKSNKSGKGSINITFNSLDELDGIVSHIK